jgi:hypothetical protein
MVVFTSPIRTMHRKQAERVCSLMLKKFALALVAQLAQKFSFRARKTSNTTHGSIMYTFVFAKGLLKLFSF